MAEYIEREAAIAAVVEAVDNGWAVTSADLGEILDDLPAAEVAPVIHGEWKYFRKQGIAVCTHCSFERKLAENFGRAVSCPNCGAKMDEVFKSNTIGGGDDGS